MKNTLADSELNLNFASVSSNPHKRSRSLMANQVQLSAFGSSNRKISKFDVTDPLNCKLITPGPGNYLLEDKFSHKSQYSMRNDSEIEFQYLTQKHFEDSSGKIVFKKPKRIPNSDINVTHQQEPKISFPKASGERGLWEPNNYYHPYKLPDSLNPGPGFYEKHYEPVKSSVTSWPFKSTQQKLEEHIARGVGPGSYSAESPRKLPNWRHFGSKANRDCKLHVDDNIIISPSPDTYTPYISGVPHSSTYVFNSSSKRGCQTMPAESVGPGAYNISKSQVKPASFSKTDRNKFEYFSGKDGVGPAHYVNNKDKANRSCSFEMYSDRFYPIDRTGVFLIPEDEDERNEVIVNEKVFVRKRNKQPFNSSVEREMKILQTWVKKKVAPDPGVYVVKEKKEKGFHVDKSPRFVKDRKKVPGPGEYELAQSLLKPVQEKGSRSRYV